MYLANDQEWMDHFPVKPKFEKTIVNQEILKLDDGLEWELL